MKKILYSVLMALCISATTWATPAQPGIWKKLTLTDGTTVMAELKGDANLHYYESADGKKYQLVEGESNVYVEFDAEKAAAEATSLQLHKAMNKIVVGGNHDKYEGVKKCLCILVEYQDVKFQAGNVDKLKKVINEKNFSDPELGYIGSVRDYFYAQSGGLFDIQFDVVGVVPLPKKRVEYGGNDASGRDKDPQSMVTYAVDMAARVVNYKDYDWDGDNKCESIFILYAGNGEADSDVAEAIWPHNYTIPRKIYNGVTIELYACGPELNGRNTLAGIGTMCHEYSHSLGLPDMYDTQQQGRNYGTSYWDIMCVGNYNGSGYIPAGYNAYERWYAGWITPTELQGSGEVTGMKPINEGGEAYILYNEGYPDEYYLIENRKQTGWDAALPGAGLMIYHVDFNAMAWANNKVNTTGTTYTPYYPRFQIIPADNDMTRTTVGSDAYPYVNGDDIVNELTDFTAPASILYNPNAEGDYVMSHPIYDIRMDADGNISFKYADNNDVLSGIKDITVCNPALYGKTYNALGQRIAAGMPGLVIKNGKKFVK